MTALLTERQRFVVLISAGRVASGQGLFKIPVKGGPAVRIVKGIAGNPEWSPDGKQIVFDQIPDNSNRDDGSGNGALTDCRYGLMRKGHSPDVAGYLRHIEDNFLACDVNGSMALIVFFRGINVGGHRAFRPSVLAQELSIFDAVNVGAAGTLVVRKPGSRLKFLAELRRKLPFEMTVACCEGSELLQLEMANPFGTLRPAEGEVPFVSILPEVRHWNVSLPATLPEAGEWYVRILGSKGRFVYGVYRRHMKSIRFLGQIDALFGAPATTRSWGTICSVIRILRSHESVEVEQAATRFKKQRGVSVRRVRSH